MNWALAFAAVVLIVDVTPVQASVVALNAVIVSVVGVMVHHRFARMAAYIRALELRVGELERQRDDR